jgi:predicted CXXCH cytochrome family protein
MPRKSPFRTLLVVYVPVVLIGVFEFFSGSGHSKYEPDIYGDPTRNFPDAMKRLYPGRPETEYMAGRRFEATASRKAERGELALPDAMKELNAGYREAARHYEQAIAAGLKSDESLFYNYALVLIRLRAKPERIDRAIADWKINFPYSVRQDLNERRRMIEALLQKLPEGSDPGRDGDSREQRSPARNAETGSETAAALEFVPEWRSIPDYVGSDACRKCHARQFDGFQTTNHAHALTEVHSEDEPPDAVFDHAASGRRYRVLRRNGALTIDESLPLDDGTEFPLTSTAVKYRVGSGHFARTYLRDMGNGFLFESPVTWYESPHAWGMTPGFDRPNHRSFSRQILENCLSCHSGQVCLSTRSSFRLKIVEHSIGCERCHGPGASHVRLRESDAAVDLANDPIVNPQRLTRHRAEAVCRQCHLQSEVRVEGEGRRAGDYRPGLALEKFSVFYRIRRPETEMTVVGHVEQLSQSACYRKSETLTCTTCHDPHLAVEPARRMEHYRSACLECHADRGCKLDLAARQTKSQDDCVACHMPKAATEVPHLAFTHHQIGRHPLTARNGRPEGEDSLVAISDLSELSPAEQRRSMMLARLQIFLLRGPDFATTDLGKTWIAEIEQWLDGLPEASTDTETECLKTQFLFARGQDLKAQSSAVRLLKRSDLRSEEEVAVREMLGEREFQSGHFVEARSHFAILARLRCQSRDWLRLGQCEFHCGNTSAAVRALQRARDLEPASLDVYELLKSIRPDAGDAAAEQRLRNAMHRHPNSFLPRIP